MGKKRHIGLWILIALIALITLLIVGVQLAVNTQWAKEKVNQVLSSVIDGKVDYARLDMSLARSFPVFRVTLDTVSLTYDHEKFASFDALGDQHALLGRGRGAECDTLASFDRLTAAVNAWKLISGKVRVKEIRLDGLNAFLHVYDSTSNLSIFKPSGKEKDTTKVFTTPNISIGEIRISDPYAVFTDQSKSMYGCAAMEVLSVSGNCRIDKEGEFKFRNVKVAVDSLMARVRMPKDSAQVSIDRLYIKEPYKNVFDLGIGIVAEARTRKYGELRLPVDIDGRIGLSNTNEYTKIVVPGLDGRVAHIPLHIDGNTRLYADSTYVDASLSIADCPLDTLLSEYGVKFAEVARQIRTNAHVDIGASAKGLLTKKTIPEINAFLKIPASKVAYLPLDVDGTLVLDVDGKLSSRKKLDASVNELKAVIPGLSFTADGTGHDILSGDPDLKVAADAAFAADALMKFLPEKLGIIAEGNANLSVLASGHPTDFVGLEFDKVSLKADLEADRLTMRMPADTLATAMYRPDLHVVFDNLGGNILITTDSLAFSKGKGLELRARTMSSNGTLSNMVSRSGAVMPHLNLSHSDGRVSFRTGNNWFRARDVDIKASATKLARLSDEMKARLQERMAQDSLRHAGAPVKKDDEFKKKDIRISLDTTLLRYLRQWNPVAKISVGRGMAAMPSLPLRTRLGAFRASFDGDLLDIDTLSANMGTSDLSLKGRASGLRGMLRGRGSVKAALDAHSSRVNVNELLAAFSAGRELADSSFSENDESFVVDSLDTGSLEDPAGIGLPLVILPGNVDATMNFAADTVDYSDFKIHPFLTKVNMRDRTAQLSDTKVFSDLGDISLDAFYASRSKEEISAGVDLGVYNVSADSLIKLLPTVDSLMPVLKSFQGRLNCEVTAMTQLDTNMTPVLPSLEGVVRIRGKQLNVADAGSLKKITRLLQFKNPNIGHIDDLSLDAVIHDNKVDVFPFVLGVDRYKLALYGMQGLDKTMYYHASVLKSPFLMKFGVNVFGSFDKWGFTIGFPKYYNNNIPDFHAQIDTMKAVIAHTVKDVFEISDERLIAPGASHLLQEKAREVGYESAGMDLTVPGGAESSEQTAFEYDAMLQEEELQAEVDAILEESFRDITDMMNDYESQIYDKKILRKMAKLEKKQAKKKKK